MGLKKAEKCVIIIHMYDYDTYQIKQASQRVRMKPADSPRELDLKELLMTAMWGGSSRQKVFSPLHLRS